MGSLRLLSATEAGFALPPCKVVMRTRRSLDGRRRSHANRRYAKPRDYANWRWGVSGVRQLCGVVSCLHQFAAENQRRNQWKQRRKEGYFAICTIANLLITKGEMAGM